MRNIFKRRRPTVQVQQLTREDLADILVASWFGYSRDYWLSLPAIVKVDHREAHARAVGLG